MELDSILVMDENNFLKKEAETFRHLYELYRGLDGIKFIDKIELEDVLSKLAETRETLLGTAEELDCSSHENENLKRRCKELEEAYDHVKEKADLLGDKGEKRKCVLCREISYLPNHFKNIVGVDAKCSICMENDVQVYLPTCGHVCMCRACCDNLDSI